jgi:hypothetical protein
MPELALWISNCTTTMLPSGLTDLAMLSDDTRTCNKDVLPLLRKQKGFKDEITFVGAGGVDVAAISLWENKTDAEAYNTNVYPGRIYRGNAQGSDL